VKVVAPPLPPTGPLEISDVSKDHATLTWKPPKDDGGSKLTGYAVERRDTSKGSDAWVPVTQNCKETTFTVPSLLDGHEYEFRVMAVNENGTSEPLRSTAPVTAQLPFSMLRKFYLYKKFRFCLCDRTTWCTRTTENR
jgi:titin